MLKGSWKAGRLALTSAVMLVLAAGSAMAQRPCGPRENVVKRLAEGYGESRQSMGLGGNNSVVEVYASDETGSWTITVTMPNGMTCLLASGQSFESLEETLAPVSESDA